MNVLTRSTFADNLERLLAMHRLTVRDFASMADVSESVISKWMRGSRSPSFRSALKVAEFFKVDPGRLAQADFADLLEHELADGDRFRKLEKAIARQRSANGRVVLLSQRRARKDGN